MDFDSLTNSQKEEVEKLDYLFRNKAISEDDYNERLADITGEKRLRKSYIDFDFDVFYKWGAALVVVFVLYKFGALNFFSGQNSAHESAQSKQESSHHLASSSNWFEGGTLHQKTAQDWMNASSANRLATSADFAAKSKDRFGFNDMEGMKTAAVQIMSCIDQAAPGNPSQKVSGLAATCIVALTAK